MSLATLSKIITKLYFLLTSVFLIGGYLPYNIVRVSVMSHESAIDTRMSAPSGGSL